MPLPTPKPHDTVEDIDAELRLAAVDPQKDRNRTLWLEWIDNLLERRTRAAKDG